MKTPTARSIIVITVRCSNGHVKTIGPEGPGPAGFPMCQVKGCYKPMFPVKVEGKRKP